MKTLIVLLFTLGLCATAGGNQVKIVLVVDSLRDTGVRYSSGEFAQGIEQPYQKTPTIAWTKDVNLDSLAQRVEGLEKTQNNLLLCWLSALTGALLALTCSFAWHKGRRLTDCHK